MNDLVEVINQTPHKEMCTDICGGQCCQIYPGDILDSEVIRGYLKKHDAVRTQWLALVNDRISKGEKAKSENTQKRYAFIDGYIIFHSTVQQISTRLRNLEQENICLFYSSSEGCMIYDARPKKCKDRICDLLEKMIID